MASLSFNKEELSACLSRVLLEDYNESANNAITTLVGDWWEGEAKWERSLVAPNGSVYGIPYEGSRVAKFNPLDNSMTHIGPDFGGGSKWTEGAMTSKGIIYCPPCDEDRGILKIDTNTDDVTVLNDDLLLEQGLVMWTSCAVALDGCIYCMPADAHRIMKLDPNNNDAMTCVGDDLGGGESKYNGTVVGIDGCVYGIPWFSKRILKYDPINDITSFVGEKADDDFEVRGNGALGRDGCIYALTRDGKVLKIDTTNNSHCFVGSNTKSNGWGDAILGIDGCIYWPPKNASRTLKYDPYTDRNSLVGADYGTEELKWKSGALATDGIIYSIPYYARRVLAIDPVGEFEGTTETNMQEHPEEFGSLFQTTTEADDDSGVTNFDIAVIKFGQKKVFEVLEKHMTPINDYCTESNLCPFMLVASQKESAVCAIHHLLRRDLSWLNECISNLD